MHNEGIYGISTASVLRAQRQGISTGVRIHMFRVRDVQLHWWLRQLNIVEAPFDLLFRFGTCSDGIVMAS